MKFAGLMLVLGLVWGLQPEFVQQPSFPNQLAEGILKGLKASSEACPNHYRNTRDQLSAALMYTPKALQGDVKAQQLLTVALAGFESSFNQLDSECQVLKNTVMVSHLFPLTSNLISKCGEDFRVCGTYIGDLLKYLMELDLTETGEKAIEFMNGLLQGLQNYQTQYHECVVNVNNIEKTSQDMWEKVEKFKEGDYLVVFKMFEDFEVIFSGLKELEGKCNLDELGQVMETLVTREGLEEVVANYLDNQEVVDKDIGALRYCSQDLNRCGFKVGEIFKFLTGWTIDSK